MTTTDRLISNKVVREFRRWLRGNGIDDSAYTTKEIIDAVGGEEAADLAGTGAAQQDRDPNIPSEEQDTAPETAGGLAGAGRLSPEQPGVANAVREQSVRASETKAYAEGLEAGYQLGQQKGVAPMSALNLSAGGALVAPPQFGKVTEDDLNKAEALAKSEAQKSRLPHVRNGMYQCAACYKRYYTEAKAKQCCDATANVLRGKAATPGGLSTASAGKFRKLSMEEEGQTSRPPDQEYLDIQDLNQAMDRENSSATGGPNPIAPEADEVREQQKQYGSAHFDLPDDVAGKILAWSKRIPPEELAEKGIEKNGHITARWGFHPSADPDVVRQVVEQHSPFSAVLGKTSIFPNKKYDVVKIDVESPELHKLHHSLGELPHEESEHAFRPHVTIAHVKPGMGQKYVGDGFLAGVTVPMSRMVFSDSEEKRTTMALAGVDAGQSPEERAGTFGEKMLRAPQGYTKERPLVINGKPYIGGQVIPNAEAAKMPKKQREGLQRAGRLKPELPESTQQEPSAPAKKNPRTLGDRFRALEEPAAPEPAHAAIGKDIVDAVNRWFSDKNTDGSYKNRGDLRVDMLAASLGIADPQQIKKTLADLYKKGDIRLGRWTVGDPADIPPEVKKFALTRADLGMSPSPTPREDYFTHVFLPENRQ